MLEYKLDYERFEVMNKALNLIGAHIETMIAHIIFINPVSLSLYNINLCAPFVEDIALVISDT